MTISFENNGKTYELLEYQEVVSIGDAPLNIKIDKDKNNIFNFSILFDKDGEKTNPYRKFESEYGKLIITLFNFYDGLGSFFPDIVDLNNGYSLHISSSYIKENKIRRTQIFCYKPEKNKII